MFGKVLVANRGEIALRIIRGLRDAGIRSVAVFSEADRTALHVRFADEACAIGPPASTQSYLRMDRILEAAVQSGAEAIHPGYGFLAENPEFAVACETAGIAFIGPPASAISLMGDKNRARQAMIGAGIPVTPGSPPVRNAQVAASEAARIGYPVLLKAVAGGGGKGMRIVRQGSQMDGAFRAASSEAGSAFGNPAVYMEKYLEDPRHIEIQILADKHGNCIHLGERECSIQRRHQKVVEEAPSPMVTDDLRERMGKVAVEAAKAAGYTNAGTVEFLVDKNGDFYFMEMNTRLQVEHPVTELITGIDLVQEQIRLAAGHRLSVRQDQVSFRGHAIECRIYAEDPDHDFMPSPGRIKRIYEPQGPGIRVDSYAHPGCEVPLYYDPLISKLIAWGADREQAIQRMQRALKEYTVIGICTTIPFHAKVMANGAFRQGEIDTGFIQRHRLSFMGREEPPENIDLAVVAVALAEHRKRRTLHQVGESGETRSRWKDAGRLEQLHGRFS